MDTAARKRVGRPTKAPQTEGRVALGLRVSADIKRRLDAAAEASGRSQSQEAEFRIERSFEQQRLLQEVLTLAYGDDFAECLVDLYETSRTPGERQQMYAAIIEGVRKELKK